MDSQRGQPSQFACVPNGHFDQLQLEDINPLVEKDYQILAGFVVVVNFGRWRIMKGGPRR